MKKVSKKKTSKRVLPKGKKAMHTTIAATTYNKISFLAKRNRTTKAAIIDKAVAGLRT